MSYVGTIDPQAVLAFVKSKDPTNYITIICEAIALEPPADIDGYMFDNSDLLTYYIARIEAHEDQKVGFDQFVAARIKPEQKQTLVLSDDPYRDVAPSSTSSSAAMDSSNINNVTPVTIATKPKPKPKPKRRQKQTMIMRTRDKDPNDPPTPSDDEIASWFDEDHEFSDSDDDNNNNNKKKKSNKTKQARTKGQLGSGTTPLTPLQQKIRDLKEEFHRPPAQSSTGSLFKAPYNPKLHEIMQQQRALEAKHESNAKLLQKIKPSSNKTNYVLSAEIKQLSRQLGL